MSWLDESRGRKLGPIKQVARHAHGLDAAAFASDAALTALLERYPVELIGIRQYQNSEDGTVRVVEGVHGGRTGMQLLDDVRSGRIWIVLRQIDKGCAQLWRAASDAFDYVADAYHQVELSRSGGQMVISSPSSHVPYHFHGTGVMMFQLRGIKRVYIYPTDEEHLPEHLLEAAPWARRYDLPYSYEYDKNAKVFDLHSGEALVWPLYAPHRVENVDGLCVSLTMEYQTLESVARNGALYTHGYLRGRGVQPPAIHTLSTASLWMRWALSVPLKAGHKLSNVLSNMTRLLVTGGRPKQSRYPRIKRAS